jgi:multicomponent Na+:H+ antiporter subunit G
MSTLRMAISLLSLMGGLFFFFVGTVGLIRLPDVFSRMHATTKSDTLGAGLIIISAMLYLGIDIASIKLLFVLIFIWITNPTAAHIISKAVYDQTIRKISGGSNDA